MSDNGWTEHKREVMGRLDAIQTDIREQSQAVISIKMDLRSIEGRVNQASDRSRVAIDKANSAHDQIVAIKLWVLGGVLSTLLLLGLAFGPSLLQRLG